MTDQELIQALTEEFAPRIRELCADDKMDCEQLCAGNILTAKCIVFQVAERLRVLRAANTEKDEEIEKLRMQVRVKDACISGKSFIITYMETERDTAKPSAEVLEAIDELVEFARDRMSIGVWLGYVNVLNEWRGAQGGGVSMERYTCFENGKWCLRVGKTEHSGPWVDRLAAYEDTGLEPEEIITGEELAEIACALAQNLKYSALGPVEELSALVKARDEGRVVVLPEDGMLYHFEEIPETGERWVSNKPIQKITFTCGFGLVGIPFDFSQLGKTVFLTRAEAEAAIGGGGDG